MEFPDLQPNQYGIILAELATGIVLSSDGKRHIDSDEAVIIFDSFEEAETFCDQKIKEFPDVECNIYNHLKERISRITVSKTTLWGTFSSVEL